MSLLYGQGVGPEDPPPAPPADYRLAGAQPLKLMLGTGSAAVEVWYRTARGSFETPLNASITTYSTYTVPEAGTYLITYALTTLTGSTSQIRATLAASGMETISGPMGSPSQIAQTVALAAGATINFRASVALGFSASGRGEWSVAKA